MSEFINIERLKNEINMSVSLLTKLDKSCKAYADLRKQLISDLYSLVLAERHIKVTDFDNNLELVEAFELCISKYSPEAGDFIHYFNRTFKFKSINAFNKECKDQLNTFGDTEEDDDPSSEDKLDHAASENDDERSECDDVTSIYGVRTILKAIGRVYDSLQDRTKPNFRIFATGLIFDELDDESFHMANVMRRPFYDNDWYNMLCHREKNFTNREIASILGKQESNISRDFNKFRLAIAAELRHDYPDYAA